MKTVTAFFLMLTTIMVTTALAAPVLDMYGLEEADCRVCHDDTGVLKMTNHESLHNGTMITMLCSNCHEDFDSKTCSNCHEENAPKTLDCMDENSPCHADPDNEPDDKVCSGASIGVTDHHEFEDMGIIDVDCFFCHEKGVPRGGE